MSVNRVWTIYMSPSDYPGMFVARLFENAKPTETCIVNESLWFIRVVLAHNYPYMKCYPRMAEDDPNIVETWI